MVISGALRTSPLAVEIPSMAVDAVAPSFPPMAPLLGHEGHPPLATSFQRLYTNTPLTITTRQSYLPLPSGGRFRIDFEFAAASSRRRRQNGRKRISSSPRSRNPSRRAGAMSGPKIDAISICVEEFKKKKWFKARDVQVMSRFLDIEMKRRFNVMKEATGETSTKMIRYQIRRSTKAGYSSG